MTDALHKTDKLQQRIWSLRGELDELTDEVADMRQLLTDVAACLRNGHNDQDARRDALERLRGWW